MDCAHKTPSWVGWFGSAGYKFSGSGSSIAATPFTKGIAGTLISTIAGSLQGRMGQFGALLTPFAAGGGSRNAIASALRKELDTYAPFFEIPAARSRPSGLVAQRRGVLLRGRDRRGSMPTSLDVNPQRKSARLRIWRTARWCRRRKPGCDTAAKPRASSLTPPGMRPSVRARFPSSSARNDSTHPNKA